MSRKRTPTMAEIEALADTFRPLWRQGDVVRIWLRQHHALLRSLVHNEWSWAAIGEALTQAGITYRTGKPWTAKQLRSELSRALIPLKGYRQRAPQEQAQAAPATALSSGSVVQTPPTPAMPTVPPSPMPAAPFSSATGNGTIPRFKPASFHIPGAVSAPSNSTAPQTTRNHRPPSGPTEPKEPE